MTILRRYRRSLRVRLLTALVVVAVLVLALFDTVTVLAVRAYLLDRIDENVRVASTVANARAARWLAEPGQVRTNALVPSVYYVALAVTDGRRRTLLADEATSTDPPIPPADLPGTAGRPTTVSSGDGADYRVLMSPVPEIEGGYLVVGMSLDDYARTTERITGYLLAGTVVAFGGLAAAGWVVARRGLRPLERIADQADAIHGGSLDVRIDVRDATTEVGRLAGTVNAMLDRIGAHVREQAEAQQRIRRFMADAGHQLRTPLTVIRAYAELYEEGALADRAGVAEAVHRISGESAYLSALVAQLLTLARSDERPEPGLLPVDLAEVVVDAVEAARAIEPERVIRIHRQVGARWRLVGDPLALRMLMENLLTNVRTHTGPTTSVDVTLARTEGRIRMTFSDDGPGVPQSALPHLFDRFFRATSARRGSGLGLAIVASIVETHGGSVVAYAADPRGLAFEVELPAG